LSFFRIPWHIFGWCESMEKMLEHLSEELRAAPSACAKISLLDALPVVHEYLQKPLASVVF
jgi:hypothetical protein